MRSTFSLAVVVASLAALATAKPSHAIIAALLRLGKQPGRGLHARSGVDPSSISKECQPSCTSIIKKLDNCKTASCECTQDNYDQLGVCINCLVALGPPPVEFSSPGDDYLGSFASGCGASEIVLNIVQVTATPTGLASTGDPLSPFEAPTPTSGETVAVTAVVIPPLVPTFGTDQSQLGSASGLHAFGALGTSMVVAFAVAVAMGGAPLV